MKTQPEFDFRNGGVKLLQFLPRKKNWIGRESKWIKIDEFDTILTRTDHIKDKISWIKSIFYVLAEEAHQITQNCRPIFSNMPVTLSLK